MKQILLFLGLVIGVFSSHAQPYPNCCNEYTSVGTQTAGVNPGSCATPGQVSNGGCGTSVWTGTSCAGFITSTVIGPAVSCLTLSYTAVNQNDFGTMTTDTGGTLTITGVNCGIAGNVVGPFDCGGAFVGSVQITICSTIAFNTVTLTNSGCTSGWVINCATPVICGGGGGNAGADDLTTQMCSGTIDLDGLVTGDPGGTWTETTSSGAFNAGTAVFDANAAAPGIYLFEYVVAGGCAGGDTAIFQVEVLAQADASWTPPIGLCSGSALVDLNTLIIGDLGGTWSGTGVTGNMFDPAFGTQTITYDVGVAPCNGVSAQVITVGANGNPAWTVPVGLCTGAAPIDLSTFITGDLGGTWTGVGMTGSMFDPSSGSQTITYDVGVAPCNGTSTQLITVTANGDATWTPPINLCVGDAPIDLSTTITGTPGGTWTGTGMTGSMFDPSAGTQTITYSVGVAPCDATSVQQITVAVVLNAGWTIPVNLCEADAPIDLNTFITGNTGGTWSGTGVTGNMFDPSVGSQTITYTVGTGGCQAILAQPITVNTAPDPSWTTVTLCVSSAPVNLDPQITGTAGGSWSGTGMSGSVFDPFFGTQNITYTVTSGSCVATSVQSVSVLDPQLTMSGVNVSCFGLTDGSATVTVTGGSGGQTYLWNPSGQNSATATNLGAGSYQVTVTDGTCIAVDSVTILEPDEITGVLSRTNGCSPDQGSADVIADGGVGGFSYAWTPSGQTLANAVSLDSAMHTVVITDGNGCTFTDSILVQIFQAPVIVTMNDTMITYPNCINLTASGGTSYTWTPAEDLDCSNCASPEACPVYASSYCVTGVDTNGCSSSDCVLIDVEIICGDVFVPSAFSPNDDGDNDLECVYSDCMDYMTFTIYNRWGEKVFETNNMNICWDGTWKGKQLNSAVFVYVIDGYLINGQPIIQKGNISLIR